MKTVRMSLSGLAQNSKNELLNDVAAFLNNATKGEKDFQVEGENLIEYDLSEIDEPVYWSIAGEPVENMYNTFDINLDC